MVKEDQKIEFKELLEKGWEDTGQRFADLIVMKKDNERIFYCKKKGIIFLKGSIEEKSEPLQ